MTFPARLTELIAKENACPENADQLRTFKAHPESFALSAFLHDHAEAIRDLVAAAKEYQDAQQEWAKYRLALDNAETNYTDSAPDEKLFMAAVLRVNNAEHALSEALAKLEES